MSPRAADGGFPTNHAFPLSKLSTSNRVRMILWHRGKTKISRLLGDGPPNTRTRCESTFCLPYEVMEMITAHLTSDLDTLKACSLTCRSWYALAAPCIHYTVILGDGRPKTSRGNLRRMTRLYKLGLMPLVKEFRVRQFHARADWFQPWRLKTRDLHHFSALRNVQILAIHRFDIGRFMPGIKCYFEQFSQTLRSIVLYSPSCTSPQQLPHFLSLFPNLNDIEITHFSPRSYSDQELVPFSAPELRGELTFYYSQAIETWKYLAAACGGLRFRYLGLCEAEKCVHFLLEACAKTLETLRLHVRDLAVTALHDLDLSRLEVLRSLEIREWKIPFRNPIARHAIAELFSTIASPVFSELVIVLRGDKFARLLSDPKSFEILRAMSLVRPFELVFLLYVVDRPPREGERPFWKALESVIAEGLFDFLKFPPALRFVWVPMAGKSPAWDCVPRPLPYKF